jgi:hypothetical protein
MEPLVQCSGYALLTGFVATDCFSWIVRLPLILIQPLTEFTRLKVVAHSPATTPGIRDMAEVAAGIAVRANVGLFLVGLGLLWEVLSGSSYQGAGLSHVERLALVDLGPLVLTTAVVGYVTFVPQYWLSQTVRRQRDRILDQLAGHLPELGVGDLLSEDTAKVMKLYDSIAATSTNTAEVRVLLRRVLGATVVLLPQVAAVATKLLHLG